MFRLPTLFLLCFATKILAESLPKPTKVRVAQRTKHGFTIEWEQPLSQSYERFSVKVSPKAIINEPKDLRELSRTFSGLEAGERYTVFIQGFTSEGLSSSVLKYHVWTVPDEPTGMQLSAVQEIGISITIMGQTTKFTAFVDGMQVQWKDDSQDKIISGYDLQISPDEGVAVESDDDELSDTVTRVLTGLTPGKEYSVSLRSKVGPDYDPIFSESVVGSMRMPPAVPYSVEVVESAPTSVVLKTHGPLEGIHDDLYFELGPRQGTLGKPDSDPNYPMFDLYPWQGLRPGTSYVLNVWAVSKSVRGYKPKTITFSTAPAPPLRLRVATYDHYSVTLQWAHAHKFTDLDEVQYLIEFFDMPDGKLSYATVKNFKVDNQVVVQVQKLIPGTPYTFRVYTLLNKVKGLIPASVIQTTIPFKPTIATLDIGKERGVTISFGRPAEGNCSAVKVFYSPSLTKDSLRPTFHDLGEEIFYEDLPTDGRYSIHARCVSLNVEGPELVVTPMPPGGLRERNDSKPELRNDAPTRGKLPLPCVSLIPGATARPDSVAPDACCNSRPYHTAEKECCGDALLEKDGDRLCCDDVFYNKRFSVCCSGTDGGYIRSRKDGCPLVPAVE